MIYTVLTTLGNNETTIKTYSTIEEVQEYIKDIKLKSSKTFNIQVLVDYSNIEFYKTEFEFYKKLSLDLLNNKQTSTLKMVN